MSKRKSSQRQIAFDALCAISLLFLNDAATLEQAERIAQQALRDMGRDKLLIALTRSTGEIKTTSAAGNYEAEREMSNLFVLEVLNPIIHAQHPELPEVMWKHTRVEDHMEAKS